jgi:hypothetical protein
MEYDNLSKFRTNLMDNSRIASFMATLSVENQAEHFYILSPLAETDLHKFLYQDAWKTFSQDFPDMGDMILEASHLAYALDFLHERINIPERGAATQHIACCHMDLKPDNILVFRGPDHPVGIWKITDFGISTMKQNLSSQSKGKDHLAVPTTLGMIMQTTKTFAKRDPGTFQAPEVNDSIKTTIKRVGRKSDIWSFGCILVLIFAFGVGGKNELISLDGGKRRRHANEKDVLIDYFYSTSETTSEYVLHPHVEKFLENLPKYQSQRNKHTVRLDYRRCQDILRRILVPNKPDDRLPAEDIYKGLNQAFSSSPLAKSNSSASAHEPSHRRNSSGSASTDADSSRRVQLDSQRSLRSGSRPSSSSEFEERRQSNIVSTRSSQARSNRLPRKPPQAAVIENLAPPSNQAGSSTPTIAISPPGHTHHLRNPSNGSNTSLATINESVVGAFDLEDKSTGRPVPRPKKNVPPLQALQGLENTQRQGSGSHQYVPPAVPPTPPPESVGASSLMSNHGPSVRVPTVQTVSARCSELTTPKNVKGVFMSTSGDKIAFLSEIEVHVHFLGSNSLEAKIKQPEDISNLKWQKACLAGENLCLKGTSGKRNNKVDVVSKMPPSYVVNR